MLVLGVVSIFEPANGYQIRRELLSWQIEQWSDLKIGSVYSMLTTLARQGLLTRYDLPEGARTVAVYALSDRGRAEFADLVAAGLEGSRTLDRQVFSTAMSFAPALPREDVLRHLRSRRDRVVTQRAAGVAKLTGSQQLIPPHVTHLLTFEFALLDTEVTWLGDTIDHLEAGSLIFYGEPGGWTPPPEDSGWEMAEQSQRYRHQIATHR